MVGAEGELAPGERDHRQGDQYYADHQEDRLCVPQEPQADREQASSRPMPSRLVTRSRSS